MRDPGGRILPSEGATIGRPRCYLRQPMADGGSILQYQALDDRGDELLDEVEAQADLGSSDWRGERIREYHLPQPGSGKEGIEPLLASIEPNWQQHVTRITPR